MTSEDDPDRWEHVFRESLVKLAQVVLSSRVAFSSVVVKTNKWLNIELPEVPSVRENLQDLLEEINRPFVVDIFAVDEPTGQCSGEKRERYLLERWQIHLQSASISARRDTDLATAYKKTVILVRSMYIQLRTLPCYKLFKEGKFTTASGNNFKLDHAIFPPSKTGPDTLEFEKKAGEFTFTPIQTRVGALSISVLYVKQRDIPFSLSKAGSAESQGHVASSPLVIQNYVPDIPTEDKALTTERADSDNLERKKPDFSSGKGKSLLSQQLKEDSRSRSNTYAVPIANSFASPANPVAVSSDWESSRPAAKSVPNDVEASMRIIEAERAQQEKEKLEKMGQNIGESPGRGSEERFGVKVPIHKLSGTTPPFDILGPRMSGPMRTYAPGSQERETSQNTESGSRSLTKLSPSPDGRNRPPQYPNPQAQMEALPSGEAQTPTDNSGKDEGLSHDEIAVSPVGVGIGPKEGNTGTGGAKPIPIIRPVTFNAPGVPGTSGSSLGSSSSGGSNAMGLTVPNSGSAPRNSLPMTTPPFSVSPLMQLQGLQSSQGATKSSAIKLSTSPFKDMPFGHNNPSPTMSLGSSPPSLPASLSPPNYILHNTQMPRSEESKSYSRGSTLRPSMAIVPSPSLKGRARAETVGGDRVSGQMHPFDLMSMSEHPKPIRRVVSFSNMHQFDIPSIGTPTSGSLLSFPMLTAPLEGDEQMSPLKVVGGERGSEGDGEITLSPMRRSRSTPDMQCMVGSDEMATSDATESRVGEGQAIIRLSQVNMPMEKSMDLPFQPEWSIEGLSLNDNKLAVEDPAFALPLQSSVGDEGEDLGSFVKSIQGAPTLKMFSESKQTSIDAEIGKFRSIFEQEKEKDRE